MSNSVQIEFCGKLGCASPPMSNCHAIDVSSVRLDLRRGTVIRMARRKDFPLPLDGLLWQTRRGDADEGRPPKPAHAKRREQPTCTTSNTLNWNRWKLDRCLSYGSTCSGSAWKRSWPGICPSPPAAVHAHCRP